MSNQVYICWESLKNQHLNSKFRGENSLLWPLLCSMVWATEAWWSADCFSRKPAAAMEEPHSVSSSSFTSRFLCLPFCSQLESLSFLLPLPLCFTPFSFHFLVVSLVNSRLLLLLILWFLFLSLAVSLLSYPSVIVSFSSPLLPENSSDYPSFLFTLSLATLAPQFFF